MFALVHKSDYLSNGVLNAEHMISVLIVMGFKENIFGNEPIDFFNHENFFLHLHNLRKHKYLLEYFLHVNGNFDLFGNDLFGSLFHLNCVCYLLSANFLIDSKD